MPEHPALKGLYPFLHGERQDPEAMRRALLESVRQKAQDSVSAKEGFFAAQAPAVVAVAEAIAAVYRRQGRMFSMGNGGSSCDASHFAVEFLHPVTTGRPALTAINLASDMAMITAVGNDVGFAHIFLRQLVALGRLGDGVVGFSTSGNSENLLRAAREAGRRELATIGISGDGGGRMAAEEAFDHCFVVRSSSVHRIQEVQTTLCHLFVELVQGSLEGRACA